MLMIYFHHDKTEDKLNSNSMTQKKSYGFPSYNVSLYEEISLHIFVILFQHFKAETVTDLTVGQCDSEQLQSRFQLADIVGIPQETINCSNWCRDPRDAVRRAAFHLHRLVKNSHC